MANPHLDSEIQSRIQSFLDELSGLVRKAALDSVHEVLSGTASKRRRGSGRLQGSGHRGPGRPPKAARLGRPAPVSKRIRRSAGDLEKIATRVLAHVKSNAGHRLEQIGKALNVRTAVLKLPIQNLLARKKLRTTGQKRGMMYFAGGGGGGARKAKVRRRRGAKRAMNASRKSTVRRAAPRGAKRAPAPKQKAARKPSRKARISPTRVVATELAMDASAMASALP